MTHEELGKAVRHLAYRTMKILARRTMGLLEGRWAARQHQMLDEVLDAELLDEERVTEAARRILQDNFTALVFEGSMTEAIAQVKLLDPLIQLSLRDDLTPEEEEEHQRLLCELKKLDIHAADDERTRQTQEELRRSMVEIAGSLKEPNLRAKAEERLAEVLDLLKGVCSLTQRFELEIQRNTLTKLLGKEGDDSDDC